MRKTLMPDALHRNIKQQVLGYHCDIVNEVEQAIKDHAIVVVGMRWNDSVWMARKNLNKAGLAFTYLEYGSYITGWRKRLALKMWTGWPTFPMVFINGQLVGGNSDLKTLLVRGEISQP